MDQRIKFALEALHTSNFQELCKEYGISRKTGYKWKDRFMAKGLDGLVDESRKPHTNSNQLQEHVVCEIVRLKNAHSKWGPAKIRELYRRQHPSKELPSESSFKKSAEKLWIDSRTQEASCVYELAHYLRNHRSSPQ